MSLPRSLPNGLQIKEETTNFDEPHTANERNPFAHQRHCRKPFSVGIYRGSLIPGVVRRDFVHSIPPFARRPCELPLGPPKAEGVRLSPGMKPLGSLTGCYGLILGHGYEVICKPIPSAFDSWFHEIQLQFASLDLANLGGIP